jgi:hypothetical protein
MQTRKITRSIWAKENPHCFLCGARHMLETHEIARGVHRNKGVSLPAAWLRVCNACHRIVEGWPVARQLALKKWCDFEFYDRVAVNLARGRQPEAITESEVDELMPRG